MSKFFPGKPLARAQAGRRRIPTGRGQGDPLASGHPEAQAIQRGYETFKLFCGDSDQDEGEFRGFSDAEIQISERVTETRRKLIQSTLSLPDAEKFAAIDPKLVSFVQIEQKTFETQAPHFDTTTTKVTSSKEHLNTSIQHNKKATPTISKDIEPGPSATKISQVADSDTTPKPSLSTRRSRKSVETATDTATGESDQVNEKDQPVLQETIPEPVNTSSTLERPKRKSNLRRETVVQEDQVASADHQEPKDLSKNSEKSKRKTSLTSTDDNVASDETVKPAKVLMRPSVLGDPRSGLQELKEGSFSSPSSSTSSLVVEGKRQWKPTFKFQQSGSALFGKSEFESNPEIKKSITQYAGAISDTRKSDKAPEDSKMNEKIGRMLASQWDSRLRKVDNKFVKSGSRIPSPNPLPQQADPEPNQAKPVLLRESKLVLNEALLERLRNPSQQKQFYQAIQESMQSADKNPPKLVQKGHKKGSINPTGTALVEPMSLVDRLEVKEEPASQSEAKSTSNRRPGNIVCGICGAVRFYSYINQAKKFGTYSCEPCRKFISKKLQELNSESKDCEKNQTYKCISGSGMCVVPPMIRPNANIPKRKQDSDVRCEACWLKLCLIGFNLDTQIYDQLRSRLPAKIFSELLPEGSKRSQTPVLAPYRGEILEISRQVPLSRPLFDGFGNQNEEQPDPELKKDSALKPANPVDGDTKAPLVHVVNERLPNGWNKRATKRQTGDSLGKWDMCLVTPDQKMLRTPTELKLYIAKSGAVIDSNIVNFSLPKKTSKVDKVFGKMIASSAEAKKSEAQKSEKEEIKTEEPGTDISTSNLDTKEKEEKVTETEEEQKERERSQEMRMIREQKKLWISDQPETKLSPGRRESRVPLKYRMDDELPTASPKTPKPKVIKIVKNETEEKPPQAPEKKSPVKVEEPPAPAFVAVKSVPPPAPPLSPYPELREEDFEMMDQLIPVDEASKSPKRVHPMEDVVPAKKLRLASIGMGTFAIDEETEKSMYSGKFVNRNKRRRCGTCQGCKSKNCGTCLACSDMLKYGGPGLLKQACTNRRCLNPINPGIPVFKSTVEQKRNYIRTARGEDTAEGSDPSTSKDVAESVSSSGQKSNQSGSKMSVDDEDLLSADDDDDDWDAAEETGITLEPVDPITDDRPTLSYSSLIAMAIQNSKKKKLTLVEIYDYIMKTFPYYRKAEKLSWQNSIRHNLSLHKVFIRGGERGGRGNAGYWSIDPNVSFGRFRKIKPSQRADIKMSSKSMDESFWEPDPDTFTDTNSSTAAMAEQTAKKSKPVKDNSDRRQSIEEYLRLGFSKSPEKRKVKILSALDMPHSEAKRSVPNVLQKAMNVEESGGESGGRPPFMGSIDYFEQYDPEVVKDVGQALISTEKLPVEWLCFLCGSAGKEEMVFCRSCCEPFHTFCKDPDSNPNTEIETEWLCGRCALCQVCNYSGGDDQLKCQKCCKTFHKECLNPSARKLVEKQKNNWTCPTCLRCSSCQTADVSHFEIDPQSKKEVGLCSACCLQKKKGSFCPLCQNAYDDNDYETRMIECSKCGGWVHAKCENMNEEKYQIISYLPDSVEFVCKKCHSDVNTKPDWFAAVEGEIKATRTIILDNLMTSKLSKYFLKSGERKPVFKGMPSETQVNINSDQTHEKQGIEPSNIQHPENAMELQELEDSERVERVKKALFLNDNFEANNQISMSPIEKKGFNLEKPKTPLESKKGSIPETSNTLLESKIGSYPETSLTSLEPKIGSNLEISMTPLESKKGSNSETSSTGLEAKIGSNPETSMTPSKTESTPEVSLTQLEAKKGSNPETSMTPLESTNKSNLEPFESKKGSNLETLEPTEGSKVETSTGQLPSKKKSKPGKSKINVKLIETPKFEIIDMFPRSSEIVIPSILKASSKSNRIIKPRILKVLPILHSGQIYLALKKKYNLVDCSVKLIRLKDYPKKEKIVLNETPKKIKIVLNDIMKNQTTILSNSPKKRTIILTDSLKKETIVLTDSPKKGTIVLTDSPKKGTIALNNSTKKENVILDDSTKTENIILTESPKKEEIVLKDCPVKETIVLKDCPVKDTIVLTESPKKENVVLAESPKKVKLVRKCRIKIMDIKRHVWWGPIVHKLLGLPGRCNATPKQIERVSIELDINKNLSPKSTSPYGTPVFCSSPVFKPTNPKPASNQLIKSPEDLEVFDLQTMQQRLDEGEYTNILDFHLDVKKIIDNANIRGPARKTITKKFTTVYENAVEEICPWFNLKNPISFFEPVGGANSNTVKPPSSDHTYTDCTLKKLSQREDRKISELNLVSRWRVKYERKKDNRSCLLCSKLGDGETGRAGRLLYLKENEWVHVSCALWSSEVYEEVDGSLQNVGQALSRGSKLTCTFCGSKGATIGCCSDNCKSNYHFECGITDGAAYKEDKTVYCPRHKLEFSRTKKNTTDFRVQRTVHLEVESKKKQKWFDLRSIQVSVGSLQVEHLGVIHPVASDTKDVLIPVGFTVSRYYWSTRDPTRIVRYRCRTKLSPAEDDKEDILSDSSHLVIDHSKVDAEYIKAKLDEFQQKCRRIELKRAKKFIQKSKILPPVFVSSEWEHLRYRDLHPEWFENQQVQKVPDSPWTKLQPPASSKKTPSAKAMLDCPSDPIASPTKRLNKAVGNVVNYRTPAKVSATVDPDCFLNLDLCDNDEDRDLISSILSDKNFEAELANSLKDVAAKDSEVTLIKTWFNQIKGKKYSEVSITCNLPYEKTNFEMDLEYEVNEAIKFEAEDEEMDELNDDDVDELTDIDDLIQQNDEGLLTYVADKMEKFTSEKIDGTQAHHPDLSEGEVAFINKILAMPDFKEDEDDLTDEEEEDGGQTSSRVFPDIQQVKRIIQLDGSDDCLYQQKTTTRSKLVTRSFNCTWVSDVRFRDGIDSVVRNEEEKENSRMPVVNVHRWSKAFIQLDGSNDLEDDKKSAGGPPNKMRRTETPNNDPDGLSPRKDFSIAGLLSPPDNHHPAQPQSKPMTPQASTSAQLAVNPHPNRQPQMMPQRTVVTLGSRPPLQPAGSVSAPVMAFSTVPQPAQPNVFIHHLQTPESFQQTTGRTLQYVTSLSSIQDLSSFPQHTLHLNPPTVFQPMAPSYQSYIAATPHYSYVSPSNIILSPQTSYINFGTAPPVPGSSFMYNPPTFSAYHQAAPSATPGFLHPPPPPPAPTPRLYPTQVVITTANASNYQGQTPSMSSHNKFPSPSASHSLAHKKVARVQPQPWAKKDEPSSTHTSTSSSAPSTSRQSRVDPIKALSSMASHPMSNVVQEVSANRLSIVHGSNLNMRERNQQSLDDASKNDEVVFLSETKRSSFIPSGSSQDGASKPSTLASLKEFRKNKAYLDKQRSVGTQAKLGGPLKIMTPRPWKGSEDHYYDHSKRVPLPLGSETLSSGVSVQSSCASSLAGSRPSSNVSSAEVPQVKPASGSPRRTPEVLQTKLTSVLPGGIKLQKKKSDTDSITFIMEKKGQRDPFSVSEVVIKEPKSRVGEIDPQMALQALKVKAKISKKVRAKQASMVVPLDGEGRILHTQDQFLNEQEIIHEGVNVKKEPEEDDVQPPIWRPMEGAETDVKEESLKEESPMETNVPYIIYELTSEDGYRAESDDHSHLWGQVFEAVQDARLQHGLDLEPNNPLGRTGLQMMGLAHSAVAYLIEQLPGAKSTEKYSFKHHKVKDEDEESEGPLKPNESGCARSEIYKGRKPIDMFSWLASKYRTIPKLQASSSTAPELKIQLSTNRRVTQLELPMAMRFRHLAKSAKEAVDVFKSAIQGRGLFCKREIQMGEMVIEYAGEEIRSVLTDKREKYYESRGIGCYMFKIDDDTVVDATMKGNAARFINHSCDPNCYSKIVDVLGKKHIIIFALRKIEIGEELAYDYKFPFEDDKIPCRCGARKCRKYMN